MLTLKELRISKGLTQEDCAKYLGMSVRNYQNYEKTNNIKSAKYNAIYQKINNYSIMDIFSDIKKYNSFNTNVIVDGMLNELYKGVKSFKKRYCYCDLERYIKKDYLGKVCILYGLRRTGKTTLIFQMIGGLPKDETAYIKIKTTDTMSNLTKDLNLLYEMGIKYVFIDEITLLNDFINTAAILSDIYGQMGMKLVLSGTDSLGFFMANRDELYDRTVMIHTSFISFKEYVRLLDIKSIDSYIEYGGTLKIENMSFDDPDYTDDEVSFRDDESTRKYIDTSISRNILHTLKNDNYGEYFNELRELYEKNELTNVINRIVQNINHNFLLNVIEEKFKSHDLGSAKDLLLHEVPNKTAYILDGIDTSSLLQRLKEIIEVKEKEELRIPVTYEHIDKVKKYLIMLDLLVNCPLVYESGKKENHYIFTQPGMRYSIAKALVFSLMQDEYFKANSEASKTHITNKILEDVKGKMLEEIVLLETCKKLSKDKKAFKFKFDNGGEYDMVVYDSTSNNNIIYEVKHSDKIVSNQTRYLLDKECNDIISQKYGEINKKIVLYRGKNEILENGIIYFNVEEYLQNL